MVAAASAIEISQNEYPTKSPDCSIVVLSAATDVVLPRARAKAMGPPIIVLFFMIHISTDTSSLSLPPCRALFRLRRYPE